MSDEPKRRRDRRPATQEKQPSAPQLAGDGARKPVPPPPPPKKKPDRRAMKRVGRTLRAGSATTVQYTRKAVDMFDSFTHASEADVAQNVGLFRAIARFFSRMTFPAFLVLSAAIIAVSLMAFSNSTVTVDRQTISVVGLPKELEGYTILVLGDLHAREFSAQQRTLLRTLDGLSYNIAIFTGDMVGVGGNAQPFYDLLDGMPKNRTKLFITGDSDPSPLLDAPRGEDTLENMVLADWVLGAQSRGAKLLSYTQGITVSGQTIWFSPQNMLNVNLTETLKLLEAQINVEKAGVVSGIEADKARLPLTNYRYQTTLLTQQASAKMQGTDIHVALTHIPPSQSFMTTAQQRGQEETIAYLPTVDLVLSGHYCGGVWRLPLLGALYIPNSLYPRHGWFPAQQDVQGQKALGLSTQYTTAGLSVTDKVLLPNFRLMNPPQVSLITLTAKITNDLTGG